MLFYFPGGSHLAFDSKGNNLLEFKIFPTRVRFQAPLLTNQLPTVVLAYPDEAFDNLKWFTNLLKAPARPELSFEGLSQSFKVLFSIREPRFPVLELVKHFGVDFVLRRGREHISLIIFSAAQAQVLDQEFFSETFLSSSFCELQMRTDSTFRALPSFRPDLCLAMEADIIFSQNS